MDLRQLKYFIAVAEERNVGRAALRLHVSQPPITRQIKELEDELGVLLFERTHWGVRLTQAGEALLADAYGIRALVEHATDRARRVGKGIAGRLDVGMFGSGALGIVPEILRRFTATHPGVEVALLHASQAAQLEALRQRRLLVTFDRFLPDDADLVIETVAIETQVLALHESHPLARRAAVPIGALRGEPLIASHDARHGGRVAELCRDNGFEPVVGQRASDVVAGLMMAANGFGLIIVPTSAKSLNLPGLVYRPLQIDERTHATIELQCAYLRNETSPLLADLLAVVREYRKESSAPEPGRKRPSAIARRRKIEQVADR